MGLLNPQMKKVKDRMVEKQMVVLRRSNRTANKAAPVYNASNPRISSTILKTLSI